MAVIDKVLVGEGLVVTEGGDNEIAHIDLIMGPQRWFYITISSMCTKSTNKTSYSNV